ncbi:MAG: hypothetical protein OXE55_02860 [Flavobacteriaceae bacterium]|nr:hypothetical protein [Flavobacteriaceae bacterium]
MREEFKSLFESLSLKDVILYCRLWIESVNESNIQEVVTVPVCFKTIYKALVMLSVIRSPMPKWSDGMEEFKKSKPMAENLKNLG